jgi:hypothetical protein
MKRLLALVFLVAAFSLSGIAWSRSDLKQFYDGEARPRSEVAWIWFDSNVSLYGVDDVHVIKLRPPCLVTLDIAELLPGKHTVWVGYLSGGGSRSRSQLPLEVDLKAGENYQVKANVKAHLKGDSEWHPTITAFSPKAGTGDNVRRCG